LARSPVRNTSFSRISTILADWRMVMHWITGW
jgi:hypothetical protein